MSECVVRMEMPGCCWDCPCFDDYGDYPRCEISNEQRGYNFPIHEKRMPRCPITQPLPERHGRLVDADALADDVRSLWDYKTVDGITASTVLKQIITDIGNCPTIVPAEAQRKVDAYDAVAPTDTPTDTPTVPAERSGT